MQFDLNGKNRYSIKGKKISRLKIGDILVFEYEELSDTDDYLYEVCQICAMDNIPPSNIKRIIMKKIVKYIKEN